MKKILLSLIFVFATLVFTTAQTVDEVVAKHIASLGGEEKLRTVKSISMENLLNVMNMDLENKTYLLVNTAMLNSTKLMGEEMVQAYDGETAWWKRPTMMGGTGEPEVMPEEMAKGAKSQTVIFPLLDYKTDGSTLELIGADKVNGAEATHLKVTAKDGYTYEVWLDAKTYYLNKLKVTVAGADQEIYYTNFKPIDGIMFSHTMSTSNPQAGEITIETKKIRINEPLDLAMFKFNNKK